MSVYVPSSVVPIQKSIRRLRFLLLEHVVLPLAFLPLRMLIRSWRITAPRPSLLAEIAAWPRVIITIFHGTLLEGLAFTAMWKPYGRRWVVLTTPSLDGQLAVAMLARFGVRCTPLVSGTRGAAAVREFVARVEAGDIGVILVDGPRGPRGVVKPGVARTIAAARAQLVAAGLAAAPGWRVPSWDQTYVPAPFARVEVGLRPLPAPAAGTAHDVASIQAAMEGVAAEAAQALHPAASDRAGEPPAPRLREA
jgi:lysophospholipid acyltransferase (LPLAT)-like uncharacterized protein